jgi:hypothetical protein
VSARRRTPPPARCEDERINNARRRRTATRFVDREIDVEVAESFGYQRLAAVGGEDDWALCEWRWFGAVLS